MISTVMSQFTSARATWSRPLRRIAGALLALAPERYEMRLNPAKFGFREEDIPSPPDQPPADIRLYVAPVNFAGQGYAWARSAELLPGVGAVSMQYRSDRNYGFPIDNPVPVEVFTRSGRWQAAQHEAVTSGFTHVLIEAERSIFGSLFGASPAREIADLRERGIAVAMVSHGSDLRLPSRHAERDEWSPFRDSEWELVPALEKQALSNRALLAGIGAPVYVSTPDLLRDFPAGRWLPVVIDPTVWAAAEDVLVRERPVVAHVPSSPTMKGSALIDPILRDLHDAGLIEYLRMEGVQSRFMPELYKRADVVLDQFRLGLYGVAACEALAAGRVVLGHVDPFSRDHVHRTTGLRLPIVEATPATLRDVILDVLDRRAHYRSVARDGIAFVRQVHDGRASAQELRRFLRPEAGGGERWPDTVDG